MGTTVIKMDQLSITSEERASIVKVLILEDRGQDMQRIYVDANNDVVCCDFNTSIYQGASIQMDHACEGYPLQIALKDESSYFTYHNLVLEEVVEI